MACDFVLSQLGSRRIKGNINSMGEHAELLSSVQDDISEYKASVSGFPGTQLLRERAAKHRSISHIDDVISQAQATKAVLGSQMTLFGGVIGSISRKRSRDKLILSAVTASCYLFLTIYWLSK